MAGSDLVWGQPPLAIAVLAHLALWSLAPGILFGNLHADTLEAAYWGRDLALGYAKHPPLATWLLDAALRSGLPPVFSLMLLSQVGMTVAAFYLWKSVRLYASPRTAALAVLLFLTSPAATIYGVQVNHNSLLSPFWAAAMYHGLAFLEERRWPDAIGLAIAAGLGLITKYEMAFLLASLVALAALVPRFRPAFATPASYACVGLFLVVVAPHVWWLQANGWPSASRAMGADKMHNVATLNLSGVNAIVGLFTLFVSPVAILYATMNRRAGTRDARGPDVKLIGQVLTFGPPVVLLAGALLTLQIVKPLWVLSLTSSVAAGLALLFGAGSRESGLSERTTARILACLSAAIFAGFTIYLLVAGAVGKPLAAYSADSRKLAAATLGIWTEHGEDPLRCVVIADRKIGPSGVLFLPGRPDFVDFSSPSWSTKRQIEACRKTGGVAVLASNTTELDNFPAACRGQTRRFDLPAMPGMGRVTWPFDLVYIPPEGSTCDARR